MNVHITPRDLKIFTFLFENTYATIAQIHKALFPNKSFNTPKNRLSELYLAGYLTRYKWSPTLFRITRNALDELKIPEDDAKLYLRNKIIYEQVEHDLILTDCKTLLSTSPIITNWIPSLRLRKNSYTQFHYRDNGKTTVPDALFDMSINGVSKKVALEFERSQKSKKRYLTLFENYYTSIPVDFIFYIAESECLKKALLKLSNETLLELSHQNVASANRIFVTTLEELKWYGTNAFFEGINRQGFRIKNYEHSIKSTPDVAPDVNRRYPRHESGLTSGL